MYEGKDLYMRTRYLPTSIQKTEAKLAALYAEARSYRMSQVLKDPAIVDAQWDREVEIEQLKAQLEGREWSMGVDNG